MNRRIRLVLAAGLVAATVGVSGCGTSGASSGAASDGSTQSFGDDFDNPTASTQSGSEVIPVNELGMTSIRTVIGRAMVKKHTVHLAVTLGSTTSVTADTDVASRRPKALMSMRFTEKGHQVSTDERLIGEVAYVAIPGLTPSGKFFKITASTPRLGSLTRSLGNFDATKFGAMLAAHITQLKYIGPSAIGRSTVYRYTVTVNARHALTELGSLSPLSKPDVSRAPSTVHEVLYLNADDTLRRATMALRGQTMIVNMTRWGKPVHVAAPSASEIAPYAG